MAMSQSFWASVIGAQWLNFFPEDTSFRADDLVPIPLLHLLDRQLEYLGQQVKVAATAEADAVARARGQTSETIEALQSAHKRFRQA